MVARQERSLHARRLRASVSFGASSPAPRVRLTIPGSTLLTMRVVRDAPLALLAMRVLRHVPRSSFSSAALLATRVSETVQPAQPPSSLMVRRGAAPSRTTRRSTGAVSRDGFELLSTLARLSQAELTSVVRPCSPRGVIQDAPAALLTSIQKQIRSLHKSTADVQILELSTVPTKSIFGPTPMAFGTIICWPSRMYLKAVLTDTPQLSRSFELRAQLAAQKLE